ncbi:hypothetical protein BDD12DRAFT_829978, partial [Trichophaea hybrida]
MCSKHGLCLLNICIISTLTHKCCWVVTCIERTAVFASRRSVQKYSSDINGEYAENPSTNVIEPGKPKRLDISSF